MTLARPSVPGKLLFAVAICLLCATVSAARNASPSAVSVSVITDEADAVLSILSKRKANNPVAEADWRRLFSAEGYVRLKKREQAIGRPFEDADFKSFVLSDELQERAPALAETLARWKTADATRAASLALAYLPQGARIRAKVYPVIKPRDNSFVFEVKTDPAIFLYLDPKLSKEKFENYLSHELHHVGYGTACPTKESAGETGRLPKNVQTVIRFIGAFGEGFAMLAAAGGPDVHPHAVSDAEERARWDRDVGNFNNDMKKVEEFFLGVLAGQLSEQQISEAVASFFGEQGAWYTVGWKMSALIEKTYGRQALIEAMCDHRRLLVVYNRAADGFNLDSSDKLMLWSPTLIEAISKE